MCRNKRLPEIEIKTSFYVFWTLFCLLDADRTVIYFVPAVAVHELGHLTAIFLCGNRVQSVKFYAAGICIGIGRTRSYMHDFIISASGPVAGIITAFLSAKLGFTYFSGANLILSLFNLIIIYPLDGACMVTALLCMTGFGLYGTDIVHLWSVFGSALLAAFGIVLLISPAKNPALLAVGTMLLVSNVVYSCKNDGYNV